MDGHDGGEFERTLTKAVVIGSFAIACPGIAAIVGGSWLGWQALKGIGRGAAAAASGVAKAIQARRDRAAELERDKEWEAGRIRRELEQAEQAARNKPPTRQELTAQTRQQYDETLRLLAIAGLDAAELQAARAQARQQYLRRLEELMG